MPTKTRFSAQAETAPWQALETQAYHAFREWHLWLVLRERALTTRSPNHRLPVGRTDNRAPDTTTDAENPEHETTATEGVSE